MNKSEAYEVYAKSFKIVENLLEAGLLKKTIETSPDNDNIGYTHLHRQTIFNLGDTLGIPARSIYKDHDLNKVVMYIAGALRASEAHRLISEHHNRNTKDEKVLTEMLLDWESARFTKPDKPLNAYDTLHKYYKDMEARMMPILKKYSLDKPTNYSEAITVEQFNEMKKRVDINDIIRDVENYIRQEK